MMVTVELWQLVSLLLGFFGCVGAFGKILLAQIDRRLNERFEAQEKARVEGSQSLRKTLDAHLATEQAQAARLDKMEFDLHESLTTVETRLSRVEAEVGHGVGHKDLSDIYTRINEVAGELSELRGESRGVADNVRLILNQIAQRGMQ